MRMTPKWMDRRYFLKLLGLSSAATAAACTDEGQSEDEAREKSFEYIVVGSGAGGAPLACNLARHGHRVLLLEAGSDQGHLTSQQVPALHVKSTEEPTMRWDFFVKHYDDPTQAELDSKYTADPGPHQEPGVLYPRAGTLGGCTAHHAMITVYPHASDWDHIADVTGDESWRPSEMRRYFEILERCRYLDRGDDAARGHGFDGWLRTSMPDARIGIGDSKLLKIIVAAAKAFSNDSFFDGPLSSIFSGNAFAIKQLMGLIRRDLNSADEGRDNAEGLFGIPLATDGKKRRGPRELILETVAAGHPLVVQTNALVTKVLFDAEPDANGNLHARGVEILAGEHLYRADPLVNPDPDAGERRELLATREVILSAGVFNTPQLLKLSGIGPREELEAYGIDVKLELRGVGTNMQDRYEVGVVSEASGDFSAVSGCTWGAAGDPCLNTWNSGSGVYTSNGAVASVVLRSRPELENPDLIIFGLPSYFKGYEPNYSSIVFGDKRHFTWAVLKAHTENTGGIVALRSADPRDVPNIQFRYFHEGSTENGEDRRDLASMVEGVRFARSIGDNTDDLMLFGSFEEVWPGRATSTTAQLETWVRNEAWGHHASCTCPIGADDDPMAVLDSRFKVRGTSNLRVVDASVFPKIPGFFIVVPIYMVSEKATDVLLQDIGEQRRV
jgi:choline dehydrogenase